MGLCFWKGGVAEGWGARWPSHPVVSRSLASGLVLASQRAASRLDHSLELCLMAGSAPVSGGGTRGSSVVILMASTVCSCILCISCHLPPRREILESFASRL